ncbi:MAG: diguanylate cyclase [Clostridiaceae bacterium]|nr:diguanylate cyclase [Clostridiaceae bacterium]
MAGFYTYVGCTPYTFEEKIYENSNSVIKASQAISEEIEYRSLIIKLIKVLIENAGTQKNIILKKKNEKLIIEAEYEITNEEPTIEECEELQNKLPLSLIKFVERTVDTLVIIDAQKNEFSNDIYVKETQPKSIFSMPLLHQGKLNRILYFENNLAIGAFTPEKVEMLNMLSAQMVISIENSELYQKAVIDGLTQIFNRGFLDNYLSRGVYEAKRYNKKLSMLMMDIDYFKDVKCYQLAQDNINKCKSLKINDNIVKAKIQPDNKNFDAAVDFLDIVLNFEPAYQEALTLKEQYKKEIQSIKEEVARKEAQTKATGEVVHRYTP